MSETSAPAAATYFAPAERAGEAELRAAWQAFHSDATASTMLDAVPDMALVLNQQRQIVDANRRVFEQLGVAGIEAMLGRRPGEAVGCLRADVGPNGCGTSPFCATCGAVNAILESLANGGTASRECRLATCGTADGGSFDLLVQATLIHVRDLPLVLVVLRDISSEKRRQVLERVFLHDVMNTAGGIHGLAEILLAEEDPSAEVEYKQDVYRLSEKMIDEISAHRELLMAENGDLRVQMRVLLVPDVITEVATLYRYHPAAEGRTLRVGNTPATVIESDPTLLRRVLGNLIKNAVEATPPGGTVTISAEPEGTGDGAPQSLVFLVHNPTVMPDDVQRQIFLRSFSTKPGTGRGIGTYSVKLIAERYLGARVSFTSQEPAGTTFAVCFSPRR